MIWLYCGWNSSVLYQLKYLLFQFWKILNNIFSGSSVSTQFLLELSLASLSHIFSALLVSSLSYLPGLFTLHIVRYFYLYFVVYSIFFSCSILCLFVPLVWFNSIAHSCLTLCDPTDCSMPGFPVHHQLLELAQTHVHWVGDAHPTVSSSVIPFSCLQSSPASGSFPRSQFFASGGQSIGVSA